MKLRSPAALFSRPKCKANLIILNSIVDPAPLGAILRRVIRELNVHIMIRDQLREALRIAMKARDERTLLTVRLILAALKDRDIAERAKGNPDGIGESEILLLFATMIRQRRESISQYESGGRIDLAEREGEEIAVIGRFMPAQIEGDAMVEAIQSLVGEEKAKTIKDMGRTMSALKERYAGRMDFAKASGVVKELLA